MFGFGFLRIDSTSLMVERLVDGKVVNSGKGGSFFYNPHSTFRAIPVEAKNFDFSFTETTKDNQGVEVAGSLSVKLIVDKAVELYDFSIGKKTGKYLQDDPIRPLRENLLGKIRQQLRLLISKSDLDHLLENQEVFEKDLAEAFQTIKLEEIGLELVMFSIDSMVSGNDDVTEAREAARREQYLTDAQKAVAARRRSAAEDDRKLREYEAETKRLMVEAESKLIEVKNANLLLEAKAEAEATQIKLEPFSQIEPSAGFISALSMMGQKGINTLNIGDGILEQYINKGNAVKRG